MATKLLDSDMFHEGRHSSKTAVTLVIVETSAQARLPKLSDALSSQTIRIHHKNAIDGILQYKILVSNHFLGIPETENRIQKLFLGRDQRCFIGEQRQ